MNTFLQTQKWAWWNFGTRLKWLWLWGIPGSPVWCSNTDKHALVSGLLCQLSALSWTHNTANQCCRWQVFLAWDEDRTSRMPSTKASRPASQVCWHVFTVNLTQYRVVWKEGTSAEEFPSSDWPIGMWGGGISLAVNWGRRVQPLWAAPHPDKCPRATHESKLNMNQWVIQEAVFPHSPCLEFLLDFPQRWTVTASVTANVRRNKPSPL